MDVCEYAISFWLLHCKRGPLKNVDILEMYYKWKLLKITRHSSCNHHIKQFKFL